MANTPKPVRKAMKLGNKSFYRVSTESAKKTRKLDAHMNTAMSKYNHLEFMVDDLTLQRKKEEIEKKLNEAKENVILKAKQLMSKVPKSYDRLKKYYHECFKGEYFRKNQSI